MFVLMCLLVQPWIFLSFKRIFSFFKLRLFCSPKHVLIVSPRWWTITSRAQLKQIKPGENNTRSEKTSFDVACITLETQYILSKVPLGIKDFSFTSSAIECFTKRPCLINLSLVTLTCYRKHVSILCEICFFEVFYMSFQHGKRRLLQTEL